MNIETRNAYVEVSSSDSRAWADIKPALSGYAAVISFCPVCGGCFVIAHRKDDPKTKALIILPDEKWKQDLEAEGWIIDSEITKP